MQQDYYKPVKLAENTFHIYEPGGVYTTLLIGRKKALLIDTGYGFGHLASFIRKLTDKPLEVVLTHGHTDHCGGNSQFPTVYMNMMDVPTYLWYEATQKTLIVDKFIKDCAAAGLSDVWPEDFNREKWVQQHTRHFEALKNGQIFDLGDREVEIFFMPGHTVGSIVIYDHQTGWLFSGDNISDSLWIMFDTSVRLSEYVQNLMDIKLLPLKGIVAAHRGILFPTSIIEDLLTTISCIHPETDREFIHPRTGQKALKHREMCRAVENIAYVYVVYDKNKL